MPPLVPALGPLTAEIKLTLGPMVNENLDLATPEVVTGFDTPEIPE